MVLYRCIPPDFPRVLPAVYLVALLNDVDHRNPFVVVLLFFSLID